MKRVFIFETTLRDGEQSPGVNISINDKLMIAKQLEKLNVDIIEAGFPVASQGSYDAVKLISEQVKKPVICGLARTLFKDIDAAGSALKNAERSRIHIFVATSKVHMDYKLKKTEDEIKEMARTGVKYAKKFTDDIEFSPEDASRSNIDFMCKVIEEAVSAGATTINIPDTVGYAQPEEYGNRIKYVLEKIPNIKGVNISVHCHDDLGLSVANSLAGIKNGATQVEGTINGIGERAGNTALEEVIMAIKTRKEYYDAFTEINTKELFATSQLISRLTGMQIQKNKAIIGKNAFSHESGIHQHGVISNKDTYEILSKEDVGWVGDNIVIGKLSGKHALTLVLKGSGLEMDDRMINILMEKVKSLSDKEKEVEKEDIIALALDMLHNLSDQEDIIRLDEFSVITGNRITPSSTVGLMIDGTKKIGTGIGVGPVDAASNAIKALIGDSITLKEYNLRAITGGTNALANVAIKVEDKEKNIFVSEAVDEDVIMASVKAIIKAANKAIYFDRKKNKNGESG